MMENNKTICLGKAFASEEERREYFRKELRAKLPELKKIEGFPIGEDEDIINLSDPPYYTACPNPWLNDFIAEWEKEKANIQIREKDFYIDEPYASDVSEGKNNPIYNAHSYHTKVPHPAIMRFILHYTQPGDIIFDGFAGTGMTGVAARLCGNPSAEERFKIEEDFKNIYGLVPKWGSRKAICGDLSSIATFIAYNYNNSVDVAKFNDRVNLIIQELKNDYAWVYQTVHQKDKVGYINYIIWSDVFICSICNSEIIFWDSAVDHEKDIVHDEFECKKCKSIHTKRSVSDAVLTVYNHYKEKAFTKKKRIPVLINYSFGGKRYDKKPDVADLANQEKIDDLLIQNWFPKNEIIPGDEIGRLRNELINDVSELIPKRALIILSTLAKSATVDNRLNLIITSILQNSSWLYRWRANGKGGTTSGTYYICATPQENNVFNQIERKLKDFTSAFTQVKSADCTSSIYTNSSTTLSLSDNTIDYIFTDPPFGANIMYSELNFMWEAWLKVLTNNEKEAIENKTQGKSTLDYQNLMLDCFKELNRILKPDKWMTVEFSNTSAAVWNGIQTAIQRAGFIIANVAALDKKQGSFKAVTTATAVKQDLVISCYKPSKEFENKFASTQSDFAIWEFVTQHLEHLPSYLGYKNNTTSIIERSPKILFDRLITFYLMRGLPVPIDARDFQEGLKQKFIERDGMYFTAEQAAEYDEKKAQTQNFVQLSFIVTTESDAIEWLKDRLRKQAQKYQDIMPDFRIATQSLRKGDTLPELQDILNESFIQEADGKWRSPDPNEAKDREALRTKVLLKEFTGYVAAISLPKAKKLKEVRVEALRAGFKNRWEQKDFKTIVTLSEMIPQNILLEDEQLLMYYDIAKDRV
ncbi:MAG: DNA methyltransferase [Sediminibacterium sp.]|uniref:DNA methyltransferase n=1 Tax=Sediminibacterium sp. TaxID=1917865 RepID=UPI0027276805|nr:DNA methyltransferase [Sediminibacterium sp.]MDO8996504.1 DNA methyltransferase [Sediminibacterium sp.]